MNHVGIIALHSGSSFQYQNVCVIPKCHLYIGNLDSETPGDSKQACVHWGNMLDVLTMASLQSIYFLEETLGPPWGDS